MLGKLSSRRIFGYYRLVSEAEKLAEVMGREAKRLRVEAGLTLEDVARSARQRGLKWSTARVVEFENGKIPLALGTLLILCEALSSTKSFGERPVWLSDLVPEVGSVKLNSEYATDAKVVKSILEGRAAKRHELTTHLHSSEEISALEGRQAAVSDVVSAAQDLMPGGTSMLMVRIEQEHGLAEKRLAKSLGISNAELVACEAALWKRSMSAERAERADENATAQKLGRITRELKAEVVAYIESIRGSLNGND